MRRSLACFSTLGALVLVACSDSDSNPSTSPTTTSTTSTSDVTSTTTGTGGAGGGSTSSNGGGGSTADDPPGSPASLTLAILPMPFGVDLAWTAPSDADLSGYLVTRSLSAPQAGAVGPQDGTTYNTGDTVGGYGEAIFVGAGMAYQDLAEGPGAGVENYYAVWAVDQAGQYSLAPAAGMIDVPIPPQAAQIQIASPDNNPGFTVNMQPLYGKVSGTATYDAVNGLTISLSIENDAARIVYSPKAVIDGTNDPGVTIVSDGTDAQGHVAAYYGPEAMDIAASKTRDFVVTGATMDPLIIDLHLASNPAGFTSVDYNVSGLLMHDLSGAKDKNGLLFGGTSSFDTVGFKPGVGSLRTGVFSEDGRYYYTGEKNMPYIVTVDMTTLTAVAGSDLSAGQTGVGFSSNVVLSPDGKYLYTSVTTGGHQFNTAGSAVPVETNTRTIDFVKVDRATMAEVGRVSLLIDGAPVLDDQSHYPKAAHMAITPDGARAVVPVHGTGMIWMVDLATMTLIDTDPVAAGTQGIDLSATAPSVHITVVSPDGSKAYVGSNHGVDDIVVVDLSTYATSTITSAAVAGTNGFGWGSLLFGPTDGKLYIVRSFATADPYQELSISTFDPATQTHQDILPMIINLEANAPRGIGFSPDGSRAYAFDYNQDYIFVFDTATGKQIDTDGDPANGDTPFKALDIDDGHSVGVTPF